MTTSSGSRARSTRASALLHQAVLARTPTGWVHGQVTAIRGANIVIRTGDAPATCRAASVVEIDPVTALLLVRCPFNARTPLAELQVIHASILSRLLGDESNRRQQPTRDITRILDRLVEAKDVPAGDRVCVWVNPDDSTERHFPLQHAVDFAFVHDSAAKRIPKTVRDRVGENFFSPPTEAPRATREQRTRGAAPFLVPPTSIGTAAAAPTRAQKRRAPSDSFYDSASEDGDTRVASLLPADHNGRHARILAALEADPALLNYYLTVQSRQAESSKRHHVELEDDYGKADNKSSKFEFCPTSTQERIHRITMAPRPSVRHTGLSIMHLQWLKQLDKIQWVLASGVNMQNFSAGISAPAASEPSSVEDVVTALAAMRSYCAAFASPETIEFAQALLSFAQQLVGMELWGQSDLKYLVFWINGRLESSRSCSARDATDGGSTRFRVQDTLSQMHPDFQAIVQLITTQWVTEALLAAKASRSHGAPSPYGPQERPGRGLDGARGQRRVGEQGQQRGGTRVPADVLHLVPRNGGKSLCLRSLSAAGCNGARGNPAECFDPNRSHFVPASLPKLVRDFIQQQYGGLRSDAQHL